MAVVKSHVINRIDPHGDGVAIQLGAENGNVITLIFTTEQAKSLNKFPNETVTLTIE